jgi:hypothetical protein
VDLPFLDRELELRRLEAALASRSLTLCVLYGRRRCGKSRLVLEATRGRKAAYYIGDEREGAVERRGVARAIATLLPGFDKVEYPDWESLLDRWWEAAPRGAVLALDEFQFLAAVSPELPSLIQKRLDERRPGGPHLILCGSSQRMMLGMVLDATAPLYGRARELMKIEPLPAGWLGKAFPSMSTMALLEAYAIWGGVPRYWELAREFPSTAEAVTGLVADPLGVLRREPERLLFDDFREIAQASSVLTLIGEGCHKLSEIAGLLGKPATSLSRPMTRLVELGLVQRETPFGVPERDAKRSRYRIADPFLRFWFRFIEPRRSIIDARQAAAIEQDYQAFLPGHVGEAWEDLARASVARLKIGGKGWRPASRWWGAGSDKLPLELDIVAESVDRASLLVGEAKLRVQARGWSGLMADLKSRIERFPLREGRKVIPCIWYAEGPRPPPGVAAISVSQAIEALR